MGIVDARLRPLYLYSSLSAQPLLCFDDLTDRRNDNGSTAESSSSLYPVPPLPELPIPNARFLTLVLDNS